MNTVATHQQPVETDEPSFGRVQSWALPTDEDSLWMLSKDVFQKYWSDIVFGSCIPGAVWEIRAPTAPTKVSVLDGYLTVDFGAWHFHLCIGHFNGASEEEAFQRRTGRAELYRALNKQGKPKSWGLRLFNNAGQQQMTVFLPNPFLTPEQKIADAPDWSRLAMWDWLRETYLGLPSDPFDRSGQGFSCSA
ncbi:MAG: hypothetical protein LBV14_06030 [Acidovorax sp.]|jgi:hypothetical protein|nr:hypothetical protein [Acidovorax sp.]